jgi:RNA polymerase sigma-70 factor (ECF subfamily)
MDESLEQAVRNLKANRAAEDSAEHLVRALHPRLLSYFRRNHFSEADAEDLAQETFRRVFNGIGGLKDDARFRAWFFEIARNVRSSAHTSASHRRAGLFDELEADDAAMVDPAPNPLSGALQREALSRTWKAVGALPGQQKQCLVLQVVHEMSYAEIATVLHLSIETVRTHLREARMNLRRELSETSLRAMPDGLV